jgi:hypothetical protein
VRPLKLQDSSCLIIESYNACFGQFMPWSQADVGWAYYAGIHGAIDHMHHTLSAARYTEYLQVSKRQTKYWVAVGTKRDGKAASHFISNGKCVKD